MTWMCQCPRECPDDVPTCASCLMERPPDEGKGRTGYIPRCGTCGEPGKKMIVTEGRYECFGCRMRRIERGAARGNDAPCLEPGCGKTVGEHRAELRACLARIEARVLPRSTPDRPPAAPLTLLGRGQVAAPRPEPDLGW